MFKVQISNHTFAVRVYYILSPLVKFPSYSSPLLNTWVAQLLYGCTLSHVYIANTACTGVAFQSIGSSIAGWRPQKCSCQNFAIWQQCCQAVLTKTQICSFFFFPVSFSSYNSREYPGRGMDGWSWELREGCLIRTTLLFLVREHEVKKKMKKCI